METPIIYGSENQLLVLIRFSIRLRHEGPIFDQVVYVAKRALRSGQVRPGQLFPSVRTLAAELKIHPNTAHKAVKHLVDSGWPNTPPGSATQAPELPGSSTGAPATA